MTGTYVYTGIGHEIDQEAAWDYLRDGYLLAPRTVLKGRKKLPPPSLSGVPVDLKNISLAVQQILEDVMGNIAGELRAVMFTGGFDSMLLASLAQRCGAQVAAVTVRFDDFNPLTVAAASQSANKLGLGHHILQVKIVEFLSAFEELAGITDEPVLDLDLAIVYAAFKKYDHRIGGDVFISGMGSDQWFGPVSSRMAKFRGLAARLDWAMVDEGAHQRVAQAHGCKFIFPFLSRPMLALSQSIPAAMKEDKKLLRTLGVAKAIPDRGARSEVQVPTSIRHILIKMYGERAWPNPVSVDNGRGTDDQTLRQIVLGLWLEKMKER
ncbi:MAG: asparagine synthase-related protein [Candidatus Omnitrophota bacterium]|nr:asparagine synthase-related protein [Candidatus Omnitrophota bacterium]MDZ4243132.1 asparagine synthase-related protein [Candidatus Omnitrophota bacterium]